MTHRLTTNYAKNYCNRTLIVKVILENVVTCFFGTRCITVSYCFNLSLSDIVLPTGRPMSVPLLILGLFHNSLRVLSIGRTFLIFTIP